MPELPEVESVRRQLEPVLAKVQIADVELRRPDLRMPFPRGFRDRLRGQTVLALSRRAKYLLAELSSNDTLLMHLGMSGSFHVVIPVGAENERPDSRPDPHDHVAFHLASGTVVIFNDPRRFGFMDLLTPAERERHLVLSRLGPEPLSPDFDGAMLARACHGRKTSLKSALLDQRTVAGLGNIYASEALHVASLSPWRRAGSIATPSGAARETADRLAAAIKKVLGLAIERVSARGYRASRFRVYEREGKPCPRRTCPGVIRRRTQAGRSTFYCPVCQR